MVCKVRSQFHLHGDNIVECERVLKLIIQAMGDSCTVVGPQGSLVSPHYLLISDDSEMVFTLFPGYGRWDQDILSFIRSDTTLREAADCVITCLENGYEKPLMAIEYCSALPAGNNAWQRSGRAYSFANSGIPYLYLNDIGGYELNKKREKKARRYPNPAVPFSFVSLTLNTEICSLPVFFLNPSADEVFSQHFKQVCGDEEIEAFILGKLLKTCTKEIEEALLNKAILFSELLHNRPDRAKPIDDFSASDVYARWPEISGLADYASRFKGFDWKKSITIPITETAKKLLYFCRDNGIGVTKSTLPLCIIPEEAYELFCEFLLSLYPSLSKDVIEWFKNNKHLAVCWIAGFKPRGDDSRPDRGLVPLSRMLLGEKVPLLSIVYGPGTKKTWRLLAKSREEIAEKNGLWESICKLSNVVIVDSTTSLRLVERAYILRRDLQENSGVVVPSLKEDATLYKKGIPCVNEEPSKYGENDVDTIIHYLFTHGMKDVCFEGMCNPPGGDWSGISILDRSRKYEFRWQNLPRVSGTGTKRPDHVIQMFIGVKPIVLAIESKELARSVEKDIGPALKTYLRNLFAFKPSVQRDFPAGNWYSGNTTYDLTEARLASAVVFFSGNENEVIAKMNRSQADVVIALLYTHRAHKCHIMCGYCSEHGEEIHDAIAFTAAQHPQDYELKTIKKL